MDESYRDEIAYELVIVANLHEGQGNIHYGRGLRSQAEECLAGNGSVESYALILGRAEEAL
ncbi:hypothetical protein KIV66_gp92 [Mycobacterium phage MyraDee]|uniref:DUF7273 domain-containing protein n=1 Tax=Mycobacterium phage MyraDee TaxID=2024303 RepID=A0A222YY43_9CAUD|nr:hypothetical protein KIV66_gp92 [Mycobacterium phage MyraDee]ASR77199.1 hypothetical protein SEA_MYRADEE_92 [Mycobacterium phage MyraDee]